MSWPEAIGVRSTSIGAPAAIVEASGFIWEMNGQSVAAPPTAAAAPVATKRKSRRVVSTEDAVVTIPNPFSAAAGGTTPRQRIDEAGEAAGARDPRGGRKTTFPHPIGRNKQSRIVLLAPLPEERKPAIGWPACNALIPRRAMIYSVISWGDRKGRHDNADCAFPARYSPERRDDSASLRLPRRGRPHYRARRLSGIRPPFPPGRHGLSRPGDHHAPRFLAKIRAMAQGRGIPA